MLLLNARSLNTEKDELIVTVMKYEPDILAINETWLKGGDENLTPTLPNYKHIEHDKVERGGVGFYVKRGITTRER